MLLKLIVLGLLVIGSCAKILEDADVVHAFGSGAHRNILKKNAEQDRTLPINLSIVKSKKPVHLTSVVNGGNGNSRNNNPLPLCEIDYTHSLDVCSFSFYKEISFNVSGGPGPVFAWDGFAHGYDKTIGVMVDVYFDCNHTDEQPLNDWLYNSVVAGQPPIPARDFETFNVRVPYQATSTTQVSACQRPLYTVLTGGVDTIHEMSDIVYAASHGQVGFAIRTFDTDWYTNSPTALAVRRELTRIVKTDVMAFNTQPNHILQNKIRTDKYQTIGWSYGGGTILNIQDTSVTSQFNKDGSGWVWSIADMEAGYQGPAMYLSTATGFPMMNRLRPQAANHHPDQYTIFYPGSNHLQCGDHLCDMCALSVYEEQTPNDYLASWSAIALGTCSLLCLADPPAEVIRIPFLPQANFTSVRNDYYTLFTAAHQFGDHAAKAMLQPDIVELDPRNVNNNPAGFHYFHGTQCGDKTYDPVTTPTYLNNKYNPYTIWHDGLAPCLTNPASCGFILDGNFNYFETQPTAAQRAQYCKPKGM